MQQQRIDTLGNFLEHRLTDCDMLLKLSQDNKNLSRLIKGDLSFYVNILKKTDPKFAISLKDIVFGDDVNKNYQVFVNKCKEKEYNYLKSTGGVVNIDIGYTNHINILDLSFNKYSNYGKLKRAGIDDNNSYQGAKNLNDTQIKAMLDLKNAGIDDRESYWGARDLINDAQIDTMLEFKRLGINDDFSYNVARYLNDAQIKTMLDLKSRGIDDYNSYKGARDLNDT
jgi:hypothetical protein